MTLLQRCRRGDQVAWSIIVRSHERYVYAVCVRGYQLDETEAEEVFQETFARTWSNLERIDDEAALRSWLAQVARRLCIDRIRARRRVQTNADAGLTVTDPADRLAEIDLALDIRDALDMLPEDSREVIDRFFCRDQSYAQISRDLGIPEGTVASRISRSLTRLRLALATHAP
jgi:RNA polymerase sigma-70 factor (ECF subfamily)